MLWEEDGGLAMEQRVLLAVEEIHPLHASLAKDVHQTLETGNGGKTHE